jgi:Ankyrin repeats (many copies)
MDIFEACRDGDLERVEEMVMKDLSVVNARDKDRWTPLHVVCVYGQLEIAKFLVSKGADMNANEEFGRTPLHFACMNAPLYHASCHGHLAIAKFLVWKGTDARSLNIHKHCAMLIASTSGNDPIGNYMSKQTVRDVFLLLCHSRCMPHDLVCSLFTYL